MKLYIKGAFLLLLTMFSLTFWNPPYGMDSVDPVETFLNGKFPDESPSYGNWTVKNAFEGLTFVDPIAMQQIPETDSFIVAEKIGRLILIDKNGLKKEILDIRDSVVVSGDAGFINFILHPEFGQSGSKNKEYLYAYYSYHPYLNEDSNERLNKFVRYNVNLDNFTIDPLSEYVIIQEYDPQEYHMGGGMFFDEEGYFYLTFGDGGSSNNHFGSTQQITDRFWGGIIRIDLDMDYSRSHEPRRSIKNYPTKPDYIPDALTQGYLIPNDNPFIDEEGGVLEEFYGLGLRSPHRATYDSVEKEIWIGDVGEAAREEITIMKKGGNAQWPYMEGTVRGPREKPSQIIGTEVKPIFDYTRDMGISIIGGYVYRGNKWKQQLSGKYIYMDYGSANVWAFDKNANENTLLAVIPEFGSGDKSGISSFGTDDDGSIYLLQLYGKNQDGGIIYQLVPEEQKEFIAPKTLSETGAFKDLNNLTPNDYFIPYEPISPLWSDHAIKSRWIALPHDGKFDKTDEKIVFADEANWKFPAGTVFIKHFELPINHQTGETKKIETRFYIIDKNGRGYGLTYKWNEEETEAYLLDSGENRPINIINSNGDSEIQTWSYPSPTQCNSCHNSNAGFVLGVNSWQLNKNIFYTQNSVDANQLETWNHLGIFDKEMDDEYFNQLPKAVSLDDSQEELIEKVSSYLASNCAYCHQPGGVDAVFDARLSTHMSEKKLVNFIGEAHNTPLGSLLVKPGDHDNSELWVRDNSLESNKMPPIGKNVVDQEWVDILAEWINSLNGEDYASCQKFNLSDQNILGEPINGYGPIEINQSNGEIDAFDGGTLTVNGEEFEFGIGTHAESSIDFDIEEKFTVFTTQYGIDDESCDGASAKFQIFKDGELAFSSQTMKKNESARKVSLDVRQVKILTLKVVSQHDPIACDHANWLNPTLLDGLDSDGDFVCDKEDQCHGYDDRIDDNFNGIPDGCEFSNKEEIIKLNIFPNPVTDNFTFKISAPEEYSKKASIILTDINGRIIYEDHQGNFDIEYRYDRYLEPGIYFMNVRSGNHTTTKKIIKSNLN